MKYRLLNLTTAKIVVLLVAIIITSSIAVFTSPKAHPDEKIHINAFKYFEGKFWPPDLGSDEIKYSSYGKSRVYSGEIVYILYGNLAKLLTQIWNIDPPYLVYRFFNLVLFIVTLGLLFFTNSSQINLPALGFVFACFPRVYYTYAYANSDGWALSISVFLFLFVLKKCSIPVFAWKAKDIILLGVLTGLLLVSKKNFYFSLILPYVLMIHRFLKAILSKEISFDIRWLKKVLLGVIPVILIIAPLKIIYPLSQGDNKKARRAMAEEKAKEGFKPSNPSHPTLKLIRKGFTYRRLLTGTPWLEWTVKTFWGAYAGPNVWHPRWIYYLVFLGFLGLTSLTILGWMIKQDEYHPTHTLLLLTSALVIGLNILASLRWSLYIDFQPQGRYLLPAMIPVSLWLGFSNKRAKFLNEMKGAILLISYILCIYSLLYICLPNLIPKI